MSPKPKAIYPGSFDPITNGHLDILDRSLSIFSEVMIVVAGTGHKNPLFTVEERVKLIREVTADRKGVTVDHWPGLIMDYARNHGYSAVIRGLRAASDFEYEFMMASMNKQLNPKTETLFMMTAQNLYFVSSSMIKELFHYGGDISAYVPELVTQRLKEKIPLRQIKK
ncbi:MAG TPA: pantetheine-phosphate adenylyltransferase [Bdellovibrionales bacterium]|nr:MAG: pantetheine-phosphate adenylyltransferase [Bdellovibrionales bacterium GWB1_52_6]OFZ03712.1 MAG: pantetheine-phosphate adenylyltransferase [Bdellovibrionales bacterium GWA1_52_35]OFZ41138.1 MAG: pantetheine-phosphate adenylyltransferase [Bdellovibrionales bacterium GWC1_52_8]HAR41709.1 pantetheine-phosphate adenylyltransferase [Bdellovibrionales bacterium]HCM38776.1 pantetheine-phosphate adenylyltransferase [Bdellovibrionales bacterium]